MINKVHGGMLYAFLELKQCQMIIIQPTLITKAGSYDPTETHFEAYNKSIVNTGITGISRQFSEQVESKTVQSSSISDNDYQRVLDLKNQRMKGILGQK
jgi:hypothetical protein